MNRRFGGALLVAVGMVLGAALGPFERTHAAPADDQDTIAVDGSVADQLKDIRTCVKDINTLLHSGSVRVVVLINPDATRR
jgi:hypothetical protein